MVARGRYVRVALVVAVLGLATWVLIAMRERLVDQQSADRDATHKTHDGVPPLTVAAHEQDGGGSAPSPARAAESNPKRMIAWKDVDGSVELERSEEAHAKWETRRSRIYQGLRSDEEQRRANAFDAGPKPGSLDQEYIRKAIAELSPLFAECYELALADDKGAEGKLTVAFSVAADTRGGIVESAEIDEAASAKHPLLQECIRETIYTLDLPAPKGGGIVHIRYPFTFAHE